VAHSADRSHSVSQQSQSETGSEEDIPAFGNAADDNSLRRNMNTTDSLGLK
jgi:hypothetical protein